MYIIFFSSSEIPFDEDVQVGINNETTLETTGLHKK